MQPHMHTHLYAVACVRYLLYVCAYAAACVCTHMHTHLYAVACVRYLLYAAHMCVHMRLHVCAHAKRSVHEKVED